MPKISFRWHSRAVGKLHRDKWPTESDYRVHRLYGLMIGGMLIGIMRVTHEHPTPNEDTDHE